MGKTLTLDGTMFERGVGSHAAGVVHVGLDGKARRFQAVVGVDDETRGRGSVTFKIAGDDGYLLLGGVLKGGDAPQEIDLDITGQRHLILFMGDAGDGRHYDHFDWADARFLVEGEDPKLIPRPEEKAVILTPKPPAAPRINGPPVTGVRPGSPLIYRIPTTGQRPIAFAVEGLPEGLALDAETGILTGRIADKTPRTHTLAITAKNIHGADTRELKIVVGDTLALTPPMGWNHWYAHYDRITQAMMQEAADLVVKTGMADVGYQYVNIDDCWMNAPENADPKRVGPLRDEQGNLIPNAYFPDMKGLADYIHAKGLRAGLYTSPGPLTCAGFAGAWEHEEQDARLFAAWGYDFLKYDWCSYGKIAKDDSLAELQAPYIRMGDILKALDRDILLNLCQYGMGNVWEWGEAVGGHCWRTAGDLGFELTQYHDVASRNAEYREYAGPGAWNDPDYLQIGYVGAARGMGKPVPCPLTPNEQYSYMSLWCLMAAPLFYSGDMTRLDAFTLNVLCNPEVIAIDQDALGIQGYCVKKDEDREVWMKELAGGALAVGLFNRAEWEQKVTAHWDDLGVDGPRVVRDLWRQKDLGILDSEFAASVPRHGVVLLRLGEPRASKQ